MEEKDREIFVGENRIYLDEENIINYINIGELDEELSLKSVDAMRKLNNMIQNKADFLIDLNKGEKASAMARKMLREYTENEIDGKIAFIGLHPVSRVLASFFMGITKKEDMRFFKTKDDALAWLKE